MVPIWYGDNSDDWIMGWICQDAEILCHHWGALHTHVGFGALAVEWPSEMGRSAPPKSSIDIGAPDHHFALLPDGRLAGDSIGIGIV